MRPASSAREARRVAAMSFIRRLGDPVLKSRATPVDRFDESLRRQVSRMAGIMNDALGVGLAAPQLGISQRLLVYRVGPDAPVTVLANPELEWASNDHETLDEGEAYAEALRRTYASTGAAVLAAEHPGVDPAVVARPARSASDGSASRTPRTVPARRGRCCCP